VTRKKWNRLRRKYPVLFDGIDDSSWQRVMSNCPQLLKYSTAEAVGILLAHKMVWEPGEPYLKDYVAH
jgi:hypothetical protein